MNPWLSIWFQIRRTVRWLAETKPLYGVVAILVMLYALDVLKASIGASPEATDADDTTSIAGAIAAAVIMPALSVATVYGVSRYFETRATLPNVISVMAWSLLPSVLLSALTVPLILGAVAYAPPVLTNEITIHCGLVRLSPPTPEINPAALIYSLVSTVFLLWSFQILLIGLSEVMGVKAKRALWILTLSMLAMILIQIPLSLLFDQFSIFDMLGFSEFIEAPETVGEVDCG